MNEEAILKQTEEYVKKNSPAKVPVMTDGIIFLMNIIRKFLPYFSPVLTINMIISIIATFFATALGKLMLEKEITISGVFISFITSFITGGYLLGILYFELVRKKEYYFYYNLGVTKARLIIMTYLFHLILMIPVFIIALYAKHI